MIKLKGTAKKNLPVHSVTDQITTKYVSFKRSMGRIETAQKEAFDRMFELGELLLEHEEGVKKLYGSWSNFASQEQLDRYVLSRCKSSVSDFLDHGVTNLADARKMLESKGYAPTAKLLEQNINRILTDSDHAGNKEPPIRRSIKIQKHLNELRRSADRAEEIMQQHDTDEEIREEATHLSGFLNDTIRYLNSLDISQREWSNELFLEFCRNINYDVVLGEPVKHSEPHHISPDGTYGSQGGKVADFFAIPVSRKTHEKLHKQEIILTVEELADMHRWTLVMFIINVIASDN